jgi:hypothetical protein
MASFVQVKAATVTSALTTLTFDSDVTAGNNVVICIAVLNNPLAIDAITDNNGDTYNLVLLHADSGNRQIYQYENPGAIGGPTTVTIDLGASSTFDWAIVELNAGPAESSVGAQSGNTTTHQAADRTNVLDDAIFLLASSANVGIDSPEVVTAGDGYTNRLQQGGLYIQTKAVSAVETNDGSFTTGNSRRFAHVLAVYGGIVPPVTGCVLFSLDGDANTHNRSGEMKIAGSLALKELTTDPEAYANHAVLWAKDNGSGKTQLMVRFGTGASVQLAIEP